MSYADKSMQHKFEYSYDVVYEALIKAVPTIGFKLGKYDKSIGCITASIGMSLFSWGENVSIIIDKIDDNSTLVSIKSKLKVSINIAASHRHQKHFNEIVMATNKYLNIV